MVLGFDGVYSVEQAVHCQCCIIIHDGGEQRALLTQK